MLALQIITREGVVFASLSCIYLYVFVGPTIPRLLPRAKHFSNWSLSDLFPPTASQYLRDQGCLAKYTNVSIKSKYANAHLECKSKVSTLILCFDFGNQSFPFMAFVCTKKNKKTFHMLSAICCSF